MVEKGACESKIGKWAWLVVQVNNLVVHIFDTIAVVRKTSRGQNKLGCNVSILTCVVLRQAIQKRYKTDEMDTCIYSVLP